MRDRKTTHPPATPITVLAYGEALFDCIGDTAVLGGAPANMSVHLAAMLGKHARVRVVSARGADPLGDRLVRALHARGVATDLIQTSTLPTSEVRVIVGPGGEPTFHIAAPVAWDRIEWTPELSALVDTTDIVCYGTLAQRDPVSRATLSHLLDHAPDAERVCDLNLRAPHDDPEIIRASIDGATTLKINLHELAIAAGVYEIAAGSDEDRASELRQQARLTTIILTRGARGTVIITAAGIFEGEPATGGDAAASNELSDAVGAGDACLAAYLAGRAWGLDPKAIASFANRVGTYVASHTGATPQLPDALTQPPKR